MKSIVLRIRKEYFEAIVEGEKTVEYRKNSPFWQKRLCGMSADEYASVMGFADATFPFKQKPSEPMIAVFICGKRVHRREIVEIERLKTPAWFSGQGKQDVDTETCFALHLGKEVNEIRDSLKALKREGKKDRLLLLLDLKKVLAWQQYDKLNLQRLDSLRAEVETELKKETTEVVK